MSFLRAIRSGMVLALGLSVAAVASAQEAPIRFGVGVDTAYAPVYLAKREKLFEKHGVNVDVVQYTQGGDAADAVLAGQAELVGSSEAVMLNRVTRGDIRGFVIFEESGRYLKLTVRPGINSPKEIKKFGMVAGSVSEYVLYKVLAKEGMDPKNVEIIRGGPPEFPALLQRGDVDGWVLWEPWPTNAAKVGGKVLATSGDYGYSYAMLVAATPVWLEKNKDKALKVAAALAEACKMINADPSKAGTATQAEAKIPAAVAEAQFREIDCTVRDFTAQDIANYKEMAKFLLEKGVTKTLADAEAMALKGFYKP